MKVNIPTDFEIKRYNIDPKRVILFSVVGIKPDDVRRYFKYNIISIAQLCEILELNPSSVTRKIKSGAIDACRPFPYKKGRKFMGPLFVVVNEKLWEYVSLRWNV
jgi:hypothetical protein